ncbi:uncharacterized protein PHALS_07197 [Plasmopara halstedii]|uniref:Uncharacterized protein n=1 Tax=Plasmopara halstedii TaxID=4781 RepID=A0A0P1B5F1_PLAHL|nr:uncharacterized protein PHALS_07197 [Plasmopara halstedii]CEG49433.1 hypothetical protein PHALS_07197 [Plasmopara halstedii]|eukprot:XP_024585802.1 hypothetical protein PHALS_07197 [Plasmopara halstedii]
MIFRSAERRNSHQQNRCDEDKTESFPKEPTAYKPSENKSKKLLQKYHISFDHYLPHYMVYDFEATLEKLDTQEGCSTKFTSEHIPVRVSILDSLSDDTVWFVDEDPQSLFQKMIDHVNAITPSIYESNLMNFNLQPNLLSRISHLLKACLPRFKLQTKSISEDDQGRQGPKVPWHLWCRPKERCTVQETQPAQGSRGS